MSARTILNIDTGNRTINPRSGSSVYVDLVSNQSIAGIKTFLSNLITNANVNFKNASNQDCLIITPLTSAPTYRLQLFGTAGGIKKLYYNISDELGLIELTTTIWKINGAGASTFTSLNCGSGTIQTTGSISGGTVSATTSLSTILINASTGSNTIELNNKFFNISNGSIDIRAYYVGFPYITQSLSLTSKYMGIKPLSTGDFNMEINNITKKIMVSDWATTSLKTDFKWQWRNTSGYTIIEIDGNSGIPLEVYTDNLHSGPALRFNSGATLGLYSAGLAVYKWTIDTNGAAVFGTITGSSLNTGSGTIQTTGAISGSTITATTSLTTNLINASTGTNKNSIQMDNRFFNIDLGSIDLKGYIIGFPYYTETLTTAIKYMGIVPQSDGNFWMQINNVVGKIIYTDWSNKFVKTDWTWYWYNSSGVNTAYITLNGGIAGVSITALSGGTISTSGLVSCGTINCSSTITSGAINTTTSNITTTTGSIQSTSGSILSNTFSAVSTNTYINKIEMTNEYANPDVGEIDIISQYIAFVHPSNTLSVSAKYGFFRTYVGGDISLQINNIAGTFFQTDWTNSKSITSFTFESQKTGYTSGYRYNKFMNSASEIGSISMATASLVAFNTTSDYRLKQDVVPIKNPLERLMKLQPKNYRFIADALDECCCDCYIDGFIAHEIQEIIPICVSGVKDDPDQMQSVDYSKLTPICVGAIQELAELVQKQQKIIENQTLLIQNIMERLQILEKLE